MRTDARSASVYGSISSTTSPASPAKAAGSGGAGQSSSCALCDLSDESGATGGISAYIAYRASTLWQQQVRVGAHAATDERINAAIRSRMVPPDEHPQVTLHSSKPGSTKQASSAWQKGHAPIQ